MNNSNLSPTELSPFHPGEQFIQNKLGVRDKMERFGRQVIRHYMPEQHREFYSQLPFIFVGYADQNDWPWASILYNKPGFISASNNKKLQINSKPVEGDPLSASLLPGKRLGLLGIELETRRRNRLSTHISQITDTSIELLVDQAFGNCPQYIQTRELETVDPQTMPAKSTEKITQLDSQAIKLIDQTDTFFVASFVANKNDTASEGADVSHRGGKPGFIRVDDSQTLTIPDYLGNFHFNTLGNLIENPKAGLLFIDFEQGHLLTLTGRTEILWDSDDTKHFKGAERLWRFKIDHGFWLKNVLPLRWQLQEYSANTQLTGSWREAVSTKNAEALKHNWQPYQVTKIVNESSLIKSFYLQPPEDQTPHFLAGQFITLKSIINTKEQIRTYTVSSAPDEIPLRISVKHEQNVDNKAEGVFSSFLHQDISEGDILQAKAPTGAFIFNPPEKNRSLLLMSAGIGITPMIAMLRHAVHEGIRTRSMPTIFVICTARNEEQRAFYTELNSLSESSGGHIRVYWVLTQPESHLQLGVDYQHEGRLNLQLLRSLLPKEELDVYLCGPDSFMQSQYNSLRILNISDTNIFAEAFGPASIVRDIVEKEQYEQAEEAIILFSDSHIEQAWSKKDGSLLEFAEEHGLAPSYGCRSGQCGACKATLISGKVAYKQAISASLNENEIFLCCAVPAAEDGNLMAKLDIKI